MRTCCRAWSTAGAVPDAAAVVVAVMTARVDAIQMLMRGMAVPSDPCREEHCGYHPRHSSCWRISVRSSLQRRIWILILRDGRRSVCGISAEGAYHVNCAESGIKWSEGLSCRVQRESERGVVPLIG